MSLNQHGNPNIERIKQKMKTDLLDRGLGGSRATRAELDQELLSIIGDNQGEKKYKTTSIGIYFNENGDHIETPLER